MFEFVKRFAVCKSDKSRILLRRSMILRDSIGSIKIDERGAEFSLLSVDRLANGLPGLLEAGRNDGGLTFRAYPYVADVAVRTRFDMLEYVCDDADKCRSSIGSKLTGDP